MASKGVDHQQEAHTDPGGGKNFRSHYYDKVGFRGVDERKVVDGLLAQSPVSISKCASFALKCSVPGDRRRQLWKLILGVSPVYQSNATSVSKWRAQSYEAARESLILMQKVREEDPLAKTLTLVHEVLWKKLLFATDHERASTSPPYRDFMAVAESMGRMCEGDEVDTYWLASKIFEKLCHQVSKDVIKEMSEMCHKHLAQDSGPLYSLVEASKTALLSCQTQAEALKCLNSTSEEADDLVAQNAIEEWIRSGGQLMPQQPQQSTVGSGSPKAQCSGNKGNPELSVQIKIDDYFKT